MSWLRKLGFRKWNEHESIGSPDLQRTGTAPLGALLELVTARRYSPRVSAGVSVALGTPSAGFHGGDCMPSPASADQVAVAEGIAWSHDAGATGPWDLAYLPAVVAAATRQVAPNASGDPRIDLVYVLPAPVDDELATRRIRQTGPGSQVAAQLYTRRTFGSTVGVVQGTPGSEPARPSLPAGAIEIAEVLVPDGTPGTAAITVRDTRPLLRPLDGHEPIPDATGLARYAAACWLSGLEVTDGGGGTVDVSAGRADLDGVRTPVLGVQGLALDAPHASLDRIDLVYVDASSRRVSVVTGTPGARPDLPALDTVPPGADLPLAWVRVAGSTGALTITMAPRVSPVADCLRARKTVLLRVALAANEDPTPGERVVRIQAVDADGHPYRGVVHLRAELWLGLERPAGINEGELRPATVGARLEVTDERGQAIYATDSAGILECAVGQSSSEADEPMLRLTVIHYASALAGTAQEVGLPAYVPGAAVDVHLRVGGS